MLGNTFTGPDGATLPASQLTWEGVTTDVDYSTFFPTGATTQAARTMPFANLTQFGSSATRKGRVNTYTMRLGLQNVWTRPNGSYTGSITYSFQEAGAAAVSVPEPFTITVPPFLAASGAPTPTVTLTADPADLDPSATALSTTLKSNGQSNQTTQLLVRATPLTRGANTIPFSNFLFAVNSGTPTALSATDQAVTVFSGPSAGTTAAVKLSVANSWGIVPTPTGTYYTSTVSYGARLNSSAAQTKAFTSSTLQVSVPSRLQLSVDSGAVNLLADPADSGNENVATRAATVTVKSNYTTATVYVSATTPTSGADTLPRSGFKYRVNTSPAATAAVSLPASLALLQGNGVWTAFPTTATAIATVTGRSDGAVIGYDYTYDRDWTLKSGAYNSTVTYTVAGS
jgi:hypothetical protein